MPALAKQNDKFVLASKFAGMFVALEAVSRS
jgi:hypothetical protein